MEVTATRFVIIIVTILSTYVSTLQAQFPQYGPPGPSSSFPSSSFQPPSSSSSSSCVNSLVPCMNYLNSTGRPPSLCCDPLKEVIKSDQQCLCQMISTQGTFQAQLLGIDISEVEMLPERCGLRVNPLACLKDSTRNSVENSAGVWLFQPVMTLLSGVFFMMIITL